MAEILALSELAQTLISGISLQDAGGFFLYYRLFGVGGEVSDRSFCHVLKVGSILVRAGSCEADTLTKFGYSRLSRPA